MHLIFSHAIDNFKYTNENFIIQEKISNGDVMKTTTKTLVIIAALVLLMTACDVGGGSVTDRQYSVGPYLAFSNHQVWERNYQTYYLSEIHYKYDGSNDVKAFIIVPDEEGEGESAVFTTGTGIIQNGILSFNIPPLEARHFLPPGHFKQIFHDWAFTYAGIEHSPPITINPQSVRGNIATISTVLGDLLIAEHFSSGANYSLNGEFIWFIYVEEAVTVSSPAREAPGENNFLPLNLTFKPGWNMVNKKETYTEEGISTFSMRIINYIPEFKWAIVSNDDTDKVPDLWRRIFVDQAP